MFVGSFNRDNMGGKKMNRKEFQDMLNWMLQMNIINNQEYNNLWFKSLPYLKR